LSSTLDIEALYGVLYTLLGHLCEGRVFPLLTPGRMATPFVTYSFEAGGEAERRKRDNSTLTLLVKCVSTELEHTLMNARLIRDLLRDQGDQEGNGLPLDDEWRITTVSKGLLVNYVEEWEDGSVFFHCGHQYTFTMERKADD
jgi:hypothetical protein